MPPSPPPIPKTIPTPVPIPTAKPPAAAAAATAATAATAAAAARKQPISRPPPPTHFLCIPLVTPTTRPQLAASLAAFRTDVCGGDDAGGNGLGPLPWPDAVRPVGTLHLTLGVMSFGRSRPRPRLGRGAQEGNEGRGVKGRLREQDQNLDQGQGRGRNEDGDREGEGGKDGERKGGLLGEEGSEKKEELDGEAKLQKAREVLAGLRGRGGELWRAVVEDFLSRRSSSAGEEGDRKPLPDADSGPRVTLRGLASMQAPKQAAVLYAPPADQSGLLQAFCERVRDVFKEAELMVDEGRPLLLHATIANTVYVKGNKREGGGSNRSGRGGRGGKGGRGGRGGRRWDRLVFDATKILERYEDQVWMEDMPVERVALCRMGAKKVLVDGQEDEAYEVEAEVDL